MLTYLRLRNFRSCIDTEWHLEPVTLLIGTNNAGKSNLCKALRFVSACASARTVDDAARAAGLAPSEVAHRDAPEQPINLELELRADSGVYRYSLILSAERPGSVPGPILTVVEEKLECTRDGQVLELLQRSGEEVVLLEKAPGDFPVKGRGDEGIERSAFSHLLGTRYVDRSFVEECASWRYYNLANCDLRSRQQAGYDAYLRDDGSNLASCLFALKNEDNRQFELLLDLVREIEPELYMFNFVRPRPEELWLEVEDTGHHTYGLDSLSDGTLNYLAMCYISLQAQLTTHRETPRPRLVVLEEPENRLYVGHLRRLLEIIREGAKEQQTIITTHNPYLIDLFEDHLGQIRLVTRGELGLGDSTQVVKPDEQVLRDRLKEFSLGELHFRELLQ